jgi:hypothetical protein
MSARRRDGFEKLLGPKVVVLAVYEGVASLRELGGAVTVQQQVLHGAS